MKYRVAQRNNVYTIQRKGWFRWKTLKGEYSSYGALLHALKGYGMRLPDGNWGK